jgi:hypothetical protein
MFSRVLIALLTLVLFWSGYSGQAQAVVQPTVQAPAEHAQAAWAHAPSPLSDAGSVDEHPLDDQPTQPQVEAQFDPPGLVPEGHDVRVPALALAPPTPFSMADLRPPYLDAPQRPPSADRVA